MAMKGYFTFPKVLGLEPHHHISFYTISMTRVLLDQQTGPWQVLTLRSRVNLRVMAMKGFFTLPNVSGLEPHNQMPSYAISMTRVLLDQQTGPWQVLTLQELSYKLTPVISRQKCCLRRLIRTIQLFLNGWVIRHKWQTGSGKARGIGSKNKEWIIHTLRYYMNMNSWIIFFSGLFAKF